MSQLARHPLPAGLNHWYGVSMLRYQQFLEALTALDLMMARHHLALFSKVLEGVLEVTESILEETDTGNLEEEDIEWIRTDFMTLRRILQGPWDALDHLESVQQENGPMCSIMVEWLDVCVRVTNLLSRHHSRVELTLQPHLEAHMSRERSMAMAEALHDSMQRAQPH